MSAWEKAERYARLRGGGDVVAAAYTLFSIGNLNIFEVEEVQALARGDEAAAREAGLKASGWAPDEAGEPGGRSSIPDYTEAPTWGPLPDSDGLPYVSAEDLTPEARADVRRAVEHRRREEQRSEESESEERTPRADVEPGDRDDQTPGDPDS